MTPTPIVTELRDEDTGLLNTVIADSHYVGNSPILRRCEISTTIKKIRYGSYGSEGASHEACVIIFGFDIVGQQQRHERIQELAITFSLFRAAPSSSSTSASADEDATTRAARVLEIRHREPSRGRTAPYTFRKKTEFKIGGEVGYQPIASVKTGYGIEREQELSGWGTLESHLRSKRIINYRLTENSLLKDGVPSSFECALVIRTDGIPFSLSASFEACIPQMRGIWKKMGRANVVVGESLTARLDRHCSNTNAPSNSPVDVVGAVDGAGRVDEETPQTRETHTAMEEGKAEEDEESKLFQNIDSKEFLTWLQLQVCNNWIFNGNLDAQNSKAP